MNGLAAFLFDGAKLYPISVWPKAKFFFKFNLSSCEEIFIGRGFASKNSSAPPLRRNISKPALTRLR